MSNTGREGDGEGVREQHTDDSESEGATWGGGATVRGGSNTGRECDGEGVTEQHREGG